MTAPAGPCEWCGGPQYWTFIQGEMYVKCQGGCLGLFADVEGPPSSVSEEYASKIRSVIGDGTLREEEGKTL